jgi:hypothetical protein
MTTWPKIIGTEDLVLRFRWDKPWDDEDNFYSIQMIVSYMKQHGGSVVPSAGTTLKAISEDDHQKRVVDKFFGFQKGLRELASWTRRISI